MWLPWLLHIHLLPIIFAVSHVKCCPSKHSEDYLPKKSFALLLNSFDIVLIIIEKSCTWNKIWNKLIFFRILLTRRLQNYCVQLWLPSTRDIYCAVFWNMEERPNFVWFSYLKYTLWKNEWSICGICDITSGITTTCYLAILQSWACVQ